jgi:hypothetical protein
MIIDSAGRPETKINTLKLRQFIEHGELAIAV